MVLGAAFLAGGYLAGRLTAGSGAALLGGLLLIAALLAVPLTVLQPWYMLVAAVGLVPGYVRGRRRVRHGHTVITLPHPRQSAGRADGNGHHETDA